MMANNYDSCPPVPGSDLPLDLDPLRADAEGGGRGQLLLARLLTRRGFQWRRGCHGGRRRLLLLRGWILHTLTEVHMWWRYGDKYFRNPRITTL